MSGGTYLYLFAGGSKVHDQLGLHGKIPPQKMNITIFIVCGEQKRMKIG
jgi:hypothetical protein